MKRGAASMVRDNSYPSPNAVQMGDGAHPFYTSHHHMPVAEDLQMSAHMQHNEAVNNGLNEERQEIVQSGRTLQDLRQAQITSPQQLAQSGLDTADSSARKRSKVSRACDQCRRKKIRCDAKMEEVQCANCKRAGLSCEFSRQPQKRGPNKGYIREIAEEVQSIKEWKNNLESQYRTMNVDSNTTEGFTSNSPHPGGVAFGSRERTYSMTEGLQDRTYMNIEGALEQYSPAFSAALTNQGSTRHIPPPSTGNFDTQIPQQSAPYTSTNYNSHASQTSSNMASADTWRLGGMAVEAGDSKASGQDSHFGIPVQFDEHSLNQYYTLIHPIFPFLPHLKSVVNTNLANASATTREALIATLYALAPPIASFRASSPEEGTYAKNAARLLVALQLEGPAARTSADNLMYVQALLLMSIVDDTSGPDHVQQSIWLSSAINTANYLKLYANYIYDLDAGDMDSSDKLGRRVWLVLTVLYRWYAVGTASPLLLANESTKFLPADCELLGNSGYRLARLSVILGHLTETFVWTTASLPAGSKTRAVMTSMVEGEIDLFREAAQPTFRDDPFLFLAYLHVKQLYERHALAYSPNDSSNADDIVRIAIKVATVLEMISSNHGTIIPLIHHFAALCAITLAESLDNASHGEEILNKLQNLRHRLEDGGILHHSPGKRGWAVGIVKYINQKLQQKQQQSTLSNVGKTNDTAIDQGGLQHLADAAVGESETTGASMSTAENGKEDVISKAAEGDSSSAMKGYLTLFG